MASEWVGDIVKNGLRSKLGYPNVNLTLLTICQYRLSSTSVNSFSEIYFQTLC